jgi:hypothetical protein
MINKLRRAKHAFGRRTKWTYHDIVQAMHREEVDKLAAKMSGDKSGSIAYLSYYRTALNKVAGELSEELQTKYKAEAKQWTDQKPPPLEQLRYVRTNRSSRWEASNLMNQACLRSTVCIHFATLQG